MFWCIFTGVSVQKKPKVEWIPNHVRIFLEFYEDVYFNHCNKGNVSQDQWRVLTSRFNDATKSDPPLESQSLRNKLDALIKKYRVEKKKQSATGSEPSDWEFYEQIHRIRGPSPKEAGIPGACDGGTYISASSEMEFVDLTDETIDLSDEIPQESINPSSNSNDQSFIDMLTSDCEREIPPVETPPTETNVEQSTMSPRTKACSQPGIAGQRNKRRRLSKDNEDGVQKCMLEFTQVVKEANEKKSQQEDRKFDFLVAQEQQKMEMMSQMIELRRMEIEILKANQRGPAT